MLVSQRFKDTKAKALGRDLDDLDLPKASLKTCANKQTSQTSNALSGILASIQWCKTAELLRLAMENPRAVSPPEKSERKSIKKAVGRSPTISPPSGSRYEENPKTYIRECGLLFGEPSHILSTLGCLYNQLLLSSIHSFRPPPSTPNTSPVSTLPSVSALRSSRKATGRQNLAPR